MDFYLTTSASTFPRIKITWKVWPEITVATLRFVTFCNRHLPTLLSCRIDRCILLERRIQLVVGQIYHENHRMVSSRSSLFVFLVQKWVLKSGFACMRCKAKTTKARLQTYFEISSFQLIWHMKSNFWGCSYGLARLTGIICLIKLSSRLG